MTSFPCDWYGLQSVSTHVFLYSNVNILLTLKSTYYKMLCIDRYTDLFPVLFGMNQGSVLGNGAVPFVHS